MRNLIMTAPPLLLASVIMLFSGNPFLTLLSALWLPLTIMYTIIVTGSNLITWKQKRPRTRKPTKTVTKQHTKQPTTKPTKTTKPMDVELITDVCLTCGWDEQYKNGQCRSCYEAFNPKEPTIQEVEQWK